MSESISRLALLWQNSTSGDVTIWLMNSNSIPSNSGLYSWRYVTAGFGPDWRVAGMSPSGTDIYWQNEISREMSVSHMPYLVDSNWLAGWDYLVPSTSPGAHLIAR
ncbi:MAG: hypothetical protein U0Q18_20115 [Bryobacteraceae bacterium]